MTKRRRVAQEPLRSEAMRAEREHERARVLKIIVGAVVGLVVLILVIGLLYQYVIVSPEPMTAIPTTHPTPRLTPAIDFAEGVSDVPDGQALFVEYWSHTLGEGDCAQTMIDFPTYDFSVGRLAGEGFYERPSNRSRLIAGKGYSLSGTAGSGISSWLTAVDLLPYEMEESHPTIVLRAVNRLGSLVAEIDGQPVWVHPGDRWSRTVETQSAGNCRETNTVTLTNHGLLNNEQIDVPYWDGLTWRDWQPGMVEPTPVAVPCQIYQPLGAEGWVWDIEIGDDGSIWIAANAGAARLGPHSDTWTVFDQSDGLPTGDVSVRFVTPDTRGAAWLAFWNGTLHDYDGKRWHRFDVYPELPAEKVLAVSIAPDTSVWFATTNGAYQWDRKKGAWQHYTEEDGLHSDVISDILFTADSKVWFTSISGVSYLDEADPSGDQSAWWSRGDQPHTQGYDAATVSEDGRVWFGGQRFFDTASQAWVDTAYRGFAYDIAVDSHGGLWVGTEEGAIYIPDPADRSGQDWQLYTTANGLGGNSIRSMVIEADGVVWFGAENATVSRCTFGQ